MAYVLIGGTAVGTVLTLAFLPALYAIWFRVSRDDAISKARVRISLGRPIISHSIPKPRANGADRGGGDIDG